MSALRFSANIPDEMRDPTQALFDWLMDKPHADTKLPENIQQALDTGAIDIAVKDESKATLIHCAAENGRLNIIKQLHHLGADIQCTKMRGVAPMHSAAQNGHIHVMEWFQESGANIRDADFDYGTPMHHAAQNGHIDTMEWLYKQGIEVDIHDDSGITPMLLAVEGGHVDAMEWLHQKGANINNRTRQGMTYLHGAIAKNRINAMEWLHQHGADMEAKVDPSNEPLISYGAHFGKAEGILWLIQQGADVNAKDDYNRSPLKGAIAKINADLDMIQTLLECGANMHGVLDGYTHLTDTIISLVETHQEKATATWDAWQDGSLGAADLTKENIMQMLTIWPLEDLQAPVPRFEQLETIFGDARWKDEHAAHKLELIEQISGLTQREQLFLLGGHARKAMQQQNTPTQAQGAER